MKIKKQKCAIVGWEEGLAGQISQWINYEVLFYIHPEDRQPYIDLKLIKKKPSKRFSFPHNGKYLNKKFICSKKWPSYLIKRKIKNVLILISDNLERMKAIEMAKKFKLNILNAIHPSAIVLSKAKIGKGVILEPFTFIGYKTEILDGVLVQERASVEHNTVIQNGVTINPSVTITGNCLVERNVTIHTGTIIKNNITIKKNSIIGAGSLVLKNIRSNVFAWGAPAKEKKKK